MAWWQWRSSKPQDAQAPALPAMIQLPRLGKGMYLRVEQDGTQRVAYWDRPEDFEAAMTEAGID